MTLSLDDARGHIPGPFEVLPRLDTARNVDSDYRNPCLSSGTQCGQDRLGHRADQIASEYGVYHQLRRLKRRRGKGFDRPSQSSTSALGAPLEWPNALSEATRTGQPREGSRPATARPSPPLPPGPHSTVTGRADQRRSISRTTAAPALRDSCRTEIPAATLARSASVACATLNSARSDFAQLCLHEAGGDVFTILAS